MADTKAQSCLKYGCIGCLSLFALIVGLFFLVGAVNMASERDPEPEERRVEHPLPEPPPLPSYPGPSYPGEDRPGIPPIAPLEAPEAPQPGRPAGGRIVLDVRSAELEIVPGPAGEPIRLEADYDKASFDLEEKLTPQDDGGWLYELSFEPRGVKLLFGGRTQNRLRLVIPRGHPLDLVGKISVGRTEIDLGGLWLGRVDLELGVGDHFLEVSDPTPVPAESFRLESSVGEVEVSSLGNASPQTVEVEHSIGDLTLDLEGSWRRDATIDLQLSIGEMRVRLPRDVHVDLAQASMAIGERHEKRRESEVQESEVPADAPTLTVRARGSIGDLRIDG